MYNCGTAEVSENRLEARQDGLEFGRGDRIRQGESSGKIEKCSPSKRRTSLESSS